MGVYAYLIFKKDLPDFELESWLHEIPSFIKLLDHICVTQNCKPFSIFCSPSEEELKHPPKRGKYREPWFSCAEGVRIVTSLIDALKNDKQWFKIGMMTKRQHRDLSFDLEELRRGLEVGRKRRTTFYLGIA